MTLSNLITNNMKVLAILLIIHFILSALALFLYRKQPKSERRQVLKFCVVLICGPLLMIAAAIFCILSEYYQNSFKDSSED